MFALWFLRGCGGCAGPCGHRGVVVAPAEAVVSETEVARGRIKRMIMKQTHKYRSQPHGA